MYSKGQVSVEQLVITGLAIGFIAMMLYFSINFANDSTRVSQGQDMVDRLARSADYVYSLGPDSKEIIELYVPEGIESVNVSGNRILMRVSLSSGVTDIFAYTNSELIGTVPTSSGPISIPVVATRSGKVRFGNSMLTCSPSSVTASIEQGESANISFTVRNVGEETLGGIGVELTGNIGNMTSVEAPDTELGAGDSASVLLEVEVPVNTSVDGYTGIASVTDNSTDECSSVVTIFVTRFGGPDTEGPVVESIGHSPEMPTASTPITITAYGNDTDTGNSTLSVCQIELDYSGIWNDMDASDGAYDSAVEGLTYDLGTIGTANHTVRLRCIDSEFNVGDPVEYTFEMEDRMLFITTGSGASTTEQKWIDWIDSHESAENFSWGYDIYSVSEVAGGEVDLSEYNVVIMADAPSTDADFYWEMNSYKNAGKYVVLFGKAMEYGVANLNAGTGVGPSASANSLKVRATHYVTTGYSVAGTYTISMGSNTVYYHDDFIGTSLGSIAGEDTQAAIFEGQYVITFGESEPADMDSNGDTFATRILDYAFMGREQDYLGPEVVTLEHEPDPLYDYDNGEVSATADDSLTGNSAVALCQLKLDNGAWENMDATDGAYDEVHEEVNYTLPHLDAGSTHTITVQCKDIYGNWGAEESETFDVYGNILIVLDWYYPSYWELMWMYWIESHSSGEGFNWTYTVALDNDVKYGYIDVELFKMIIATGYFSVWNSASRLNTYMGNGGYLVLGGPACYFSPWILGFTSGWGDTFDDNEIDIATSSHYITSGYSTGDLTVYSGNYEMCAISYPGTDLADKSGSYRDMLAIYGNSILWGASNPDVFNTDGDEITRRVIDYCINNSGIG